MKKTLALAAALTVLCSASALADATVALNNYGAGAGQIFYNAQGTLAPVDGTWVQLYSGATALKDTTGAGPTALSEPGMFYGGVVAIPGATENANAPVTLRAWRGATTWEAATERGEATWTQATGAWNPAAVPPTPPVGPDLTNPAVTISVVPEPSTIALGLLGGAALLFFRRK
jgi:hypothetical protein